MKLYQLLLIVTVVAILSAVFFLQREEEPNETFERLSATIIQQNLRHRH